MSISQARSSSKPVGVECPSKQEEEIRLGVSTTIRGNSAADTAVQFNAPVAGTIIYWYVVTVRECVVTQYPSKLI
jgi:hypothetical protein